jgi:hypothetical protein
MPGAGDDTAPRTGDIVAVERYGGVLIATASKSPGDPARKPGERELYSRTPAGAKAANLLLKEDGSASLTSTSPAGKTGGVSLGAAGAVISAHAAGTRAAVHALKPSGTHYLGNALTGQDAATAMTTFLTQFSVYTASLISALTTAITPTPAGPPPTVDPGALAAFTAINTAAQTLQAAITAFQAQWALIFDPAPPPPEAP